MWLCHQHAWVKGRILAWRCNGGTQKTWRLYALPKLDIIFFNFAMISSNTPWPTCFFETIWNHERLEKSCQGRIKAWQKCYGHFWRGWCVSHHSPWQSFPKIDRTDIWRKLSYIWMYLKNRSFQPHFPSANLMQVRKSAFGNAHELSPNLMRVRTSVSTLVRAAPVRVVWSSDGYRKPCGLTMPGSQAERALMWLFVLI
jgi:hypothetical protein